MYDTITKVRPREMGNNYYKALILYMRWYNITPEGEL